MSFLLHTHTHTYISYQNIIITLIYNNLVQINTHLFSTLYKNFTSIYSICSSLPCTIISIKITYIYVSLKFPPFNPLHLLYPPWFMHLSSLATPFPMLLLTPPCLFCTYRFVVLNPCTFSPNPPFPLLTGNPLNDLRIYDFVSVLFLYLVCFSCSIIDSCEFIAILVFIA